MPSTDGTEGPDGDIEKDENDPRSDKESLRIIYPTRVRFLSLKPMTLLGENMIYAVTPFDDEDGRKMLARLLVAKEDHELEIYDDYAPRFLLVKFDGTVRTIGGILGMNEEHDATGFIARIPLAYFGYANTNMWDWISVNGGHSDD